MRPLALAFAICVTAFPALANNVYEFAASSPQHRTFAATMQATGIDRALGNKGPYTIFAPTDSAFQALPSGALSTLMRPDHREELVELLTCHMVPNEVLTAALASNQVMTIRTVGGCTLTLHRDGAALVVSDSGGHDHRIAAADLRQSNGVVHVVDSLIIPGS